MENIVNSRTNMFLTRFFGHMENSHKINFNMGHIENIVGYLETTSKYLHFALGTFFKMSKK